MIVNARTVLDFHDELAEMPGSPHGVEGIPCIPEGERIADHRLQSMLRDSGIHFLEHPARADIDTLQPDRFAHDHDRVDLAPGQNSDQADAPGDPG